MNWLWFILIGLTAGFLAGAVVKGHGFGIIGNLVVGVIGAFTFLVLTFWGTALLSPLHHP